MDVFQYVLEVFFGDVVVMSLQIVIALLRLMQQTQTNLHKQNEYYWFEQVQSYYNRSKTISFFYAMKWLRLIQTKPDEDQRGARLKSNSLTKELVALVSSLVAKGYNYDGVTVTAVTMVTKLPLELLYHVHSRKDKGLTTKDSATKDDVVVATNVDGDMTRSHRIPKE